MVKLAFFARFEAKPGKEDAVAKFLEKALELVKKEPTTINWYALRLSPNTFGVFDTFNNEDGRQRHLNGCRAGVDGRCAGIVHFATLDRSGRGA
jgi:quinol monooxygenase YgiN